MSGDLGTRVLLSVQRALLGEITPEMRAITVAWSPAEIRLRVFVDGPVSDAAMADFDASAVTQVVAEFSYPERGNPRVEFEFVRIDPPAPVPAVGTFVFARAGTGSRAV
jgi:hypothetical protein